MTKHLKEMKVPERGQGGGWENSRVEVGRTVRKAAIVALWDQDSGLNTGVDYGSGANHWFLNAESSEFLMD